MTPSTVDDGRELTHLVVKHRGRRRLDNSVWASGPNLIGSVFFPVLINQLMDLAHTNLRSQRTIQVVVASVYQDFCTEPIGRIIDSLRAVCYTHLTLPTKRIV